MHSSSPRFTHSIQINLSTTSNMVFTRTVLSHHFRALLKLRNHSSHVLTNPFYNSSITHSLVSNSHKSFTIAPIFQRPISAFVQFEPEQEEGSNRVEKNNIKKPLDVMFKEAVELSEKLEQSESEGESDLKKKLSKLKRDVMRLKAKEAKKEVVSKPKSLVALFKEDNPNEKEVKKDGVSKPKSLRALFTNRKGNGEKKCVDSELESMKEEEPKVYKELSPDMWMFVNHLYKEGYFNDANFLPKKAFDVRCFNDSYGRDFVKFAAERFGKDKQEIAKWLSGKDMKTVALFGCPSLARKNVFSAKRMRTFFKIQEDTVCSKCVLKQSCKFVNQSVWKGNLNNLDLAVVMRVITLYALEATPPKLNVPEEVTTSVNRLLNEVLKLSQTIS